MTQRLGHKQTAVMLTLMRLAREVSNPELKEIAELTLDGADRKRLNEQGLVASELRGRAYHHELTDHGWAWCRAELAAQTPPPPAPRSTLVRALYLALDGFDQFMHRENIALATVFGQVPGIDDRIRVAYEKLASSPRAWVGLVDLRPLLGDAAKDEVDAVLKEMSRTGVARLVPESNRKALTEADHAAAVRVGGEDNHLISMEVS
jgi:hypothetical protein